MRRACFSSTLLSTTSTITSCGLFGAKVLRSRLSIEFFCPAGPAWHRAFSSPRTNQNSALYCMGFMVTVASSHGP